MTHAREMLDTYPGSAGMDPDALVECIEACFDCSQTCTACADACLGEEMVEHLKRCITMCLNCSDMCATTGRIASRQIEFEPAMVRAALQACAEACRLCGEECERHATEMDMEHCRVYAERYPDEVAGMVLVDATHPEQFERIPGMESGRKMLSVMSRVGPVLAATGVIRLSGMFRPPADLPLLQRKQGENLTYQTPHLMAAFKEYRALPEAMKQARSTEGLGDKPLAVVSASDHGGGMMAVSKVEAEHSEEAAQTLQSELANLSSNSTRRIIEGSDHGSVITNQHHAKQTSEEILMVVEALRTGQSLEGQ